MKFTALVLVLAHLAIGRTVTVEGDARPQTMVRIDMNLDAKKSTITVTGDGKGDIDCYLYRGDKFPEARLAASDYGPRDGCHIVLTEAGPHFLMVQNAGDHVERYTLTVE
jgi:hypothetical protein